VVLGLGKSDRFDSTEVFYGEAERVCGERSETFMLL
jgi:hypothetical protein